VRWQKSSKLNSDTESVDVYATGISVKEVRITRGDLALFSKERRCKPACWRSRWSEKSAEGILRSKFDRIEGPNESSGKEL
jgi:hypothetical protein